VLTEVLVLAAAAAAAPPGAQPHGGAPTVQTGMAGRVALDGTWWVRTDAGDRGRTAGWARGRFGGDPVRLPHVVNAGRVTGAAGVRNHEGTVAWYRTTVRVPRTGRYALRFESVNHRADVFVDGRRVASHVGTYLPFEARPRLTAGRTHTLVVRTDFRSPDAMKAAGWHRAWFNFGGVNREVTLRVMPRARIEAPTVTTRLARDGSAIVRVGARVRGARRARAVLRRGGRTVRVRVPGSVRIRRPALWSPERPALWDVEVRAGDATWRGRTGLREIRRAGTRLELNGRPLVLRGASLHEDVPGRGDALRPADQARLVGELRRLGANATRAQHPLSPALLERLDAAGILVWQGVGPVDAPGAWTSRGPGGLRQARERVRATLEQAQTHPSILAWNLVNEVAGQGHPAGQVAYVRGAAQELRRRDPGRLVAVDIWGSHPPRFAGPLYEHVDAVGWTNYLGWYEAPFASPAATARSIRRELAQLRRALPGKVIAVTEFGAEGSTANPRGAPGGLDFQARLLQTHLRTYAATPDLAGALVWNLRDFAVTPSFAGGSIHEVAPEVVIRPGLNEKGLFTYDGRPKPAAEVVRRELARLRPPAA